MGRNNSFSDQGNKNTKLPKGLRLNAREAAEYLTGLPYMRPKEPDTPEPRLGRGVRRPGRGASGESSN